MRDFRTSVVLISMLAALAACKVIAAPASKPRSIVGTEVPFLPPTDSSLPGLHDYLIQFQDKSLEFCLEHARRGNADAHYCASLKMRSGGAKPGVEYIRHLRAAAESGHMFAQNDLGHEYLNGELVPKDPSLAFQWFLKAAESGVSYAMVSLGWQYMCGLGVAIDYEKARMWNQRGARWMHAEGANNLGWLYEHGLGGPKDVEMARYWYREAMKWGSEEAEDRLENLSLPEQFREPNKNDCKS